MCSRRPDLSCAADRATADAQMYKNDWLGKERQRSEIRISMYNWQPNLIGTPWVIYLQNLTQESWKENIPICRNMMKHIYWNYRFGHDHHPPWKPWRLNNLAIIRVKCTVGTWTCSAVSNRSINLETGHLAPRTCEPVHPRSSPVLHGLHGTVRPRFATVNPDLLQLPRFVFPFLIYFGWIFEKS